MEKHHVYLVPGFFGFTQLGDFNYFHRVAQTLTTALDRLGYSAKVIEVETRPTSSIRRRALSLLEAVDTADGLNAKSLHFVGHSTGGLDVRMLLTPGVRLAKSSIEKQIAERTLTAISLSTPHYGTPLANFFTSVGGRQLLKALTVLIASDPGRLGVYTIARSLAAFARLDDAFGRDNTRLDRITQSLVHQLSPERAHTVWGFLEDIASDQGAMVQLTPEAVDLFNAAAEDRAGVDYISFLSVAPPPSLKTWRGGAFLRMTMLLYAVTHRLAGRSSASYPYPTCCDDHPALKAVAFPIDASSNDGIVPVLSQIHGRIGGVYGGDHLDVVGQYPQRVNGELYAGWLHSGAAFGTTAFERLWGDIAAEIAGAIERAG